jgi:hypothetical protein
MLSRHKTGLDKHLERKDPALPRVNETYAYTTATEGVQQLQLAMHKASINYAYLKVQSINESATT